MLNPAPPQEYYHMGKDKQMQDGQELIGLSIKLLGKSVLTLQKTRYLCRRKN